MNLGPNVGPLPAGAWAGVVGGAFAISKLAGKRSARPPAPTGTAALPTAAGTLVVPQNAPQESGKFGGYARPTTNEEWARVAMDCVSSSGGYDPSVVSTAISKYVDGQVLTAAETSVYNSAVRCAGYPPNPVPVAMPPVVPPTVPKVPAPVSRAGGGGTYQAPPRMVTVDVPQGHYTINTNEADRIARTPGATQSTWNGKAVNFYNGQFTGYV